MILLICENFASTNFAEEEKNPRREAPIARKLHRNIDRDARLRAQMNRMHDEQRRAAPTSFNERA